MSLKRVLFLVLVAMMAVSSASATRMLRGLGKGGLGGAAYSGAYVAPAYTYAAPAYTYAQPVYYQPTYAAPVYYSGYAAAPVYSAGVVQYGGYSGFGKGGLLGR